METIATTQAIPPGIETIPVRAPTPARARRVVCTAWVAGRPGEAWETLSYVVIWLCGLTGIVLCFL
jgi:hypothetical protein